MLCFYCLQEEYVGLRIALIIDSKKTIVLIQSIGISAQSVISGRIIDKDSIPLTGVNK